jgi:hypothetical protein
MTLRLARRGWQWCCTTQHGEASLAPQPVRVVARRYQQLTSILNTDAVELDQAWRKLFNESSLSL